MPPPEERYAWVPDLGGAVCAAVDPDPVEALYNGHCQSQRHATAPHLPRLRQYATGCDLAIEFGTRHGASASALLPIFHCTMTFGSIGADGESGSQSFQLTRGALIPRPHYGIRLAIDELMIRDSSWRLHAHFPESHGLLVLQRGAPTIVHDQSTLPHPWL